ncbi:MAG: hypothetical protein MJ249_10535, partial [Kiritimatiellae bacterium]|nr:hypothetical protein [Kiritimatiellia bacterium]
SGGMVADTASEGFCNYLICNRFVGCDYLGWHSGETADVLGIQIKDDWACLIEQYREQIAKWLNVSSVAHPFKITGTWDGEITLDCCPAKTNSGASGKGGSK